MSVSSDFACPEFSRYMAEFRKSLGLALSENKWFLSERVGCDVGEKVAWEDFLQNHFDRFAEEVRSRFCHHECQRLESCPLALFIRALPTTAKALEDHSGRSREQAAASPTLK